MVMSRYDAMLLKGQGVNATIDVVPNGVDCNRIGYGPPTGQGSCVLFVASLDSDANHDGAIYFLREILPLISLHTPEVIARIVGRNPRSELLNSGDGRHVFVHANVDDVLTYYRNADVIVVPLRSGGGTRLKILEAMAAGVPVVSTSIGAEGLDIVSGENILLADTPVDFAARVVELLSNVEMARTISLSARNLVESIYDWRRIAAAQDAVYHQERNND
jgi:glycosyltransferase involved in cell wall biosynthesis